MDTVSRFGAIGVVFLLTLVFGVWLRLSGKPYNGILFNIHKLIALGAVIVATVQVFQALQNVEISAVLGTLIIFAGTCVLALFVSGALLSIGTPRYEVLQTIHIIALVLAGISMSATIYFLADIRL